MRALKTTIFLDFVDTQRCYKRTGEFAYDLRDGRFDLMYYCTQIDAGIHVLTQTDRYTHEHTRTQTNAHTGIHKHTHA